MARAGLRLVAAAGVALAVAIAVAPAAEATTEARLRVAANALALVGQTASPATAFGQVRNALSRGGVDVGRLHSVADVASMGHALADVTAPQPSGPAPGDLAVYVARDQGSDAGRVGVFVSNGDVVAFDDRSHRFVRVPRAEVSGDAPQNADPGFAAPTTFFALRIAPRFWPGGADSTEIATGRVALTDPQHVADNLVWTQSHPRDPDTSLLHQITTAIGTLIAVMSRAVSAGIRFAVEGIRDVLQHIPVLGPAALAVVAFIGSSFDGRGLHTWLTVGLFGIGLLVAPMATLTIIGIAAAGGLAARMNIPVLGKVGDVLSRTVWAGASFATTVITGVSGDERTSVVSVAIAVATLPFFWAKPIMGGARGAAALAVIRSRIGRAAFGAGDIGLLRTPAGRAAVDAVTSDRGLVARAATLGDLVSLKPSAWMSTRTWLAHASHVVFRRPAVPLVPTDVPRSAAQTMRTLSLRTADLASLGWRPHRAIPDIIGRSNALITTLHQDVHGGMRAWPLSVIAPHYATLPPDRQQAVAAAAGWIHRTVSPPLGRLSQASRVHSGARVIGQVAGQGAPTPVAPLAPEH